MTKINLEETAGLAMSLLKLELQKKLTAQGYGTKQSSDLIRSIEPEVITVSQLVVGNMYMNFYYQFVEEGVPASRVPYTPGRSRGGTSQYIQGLVGFFTRKLRLGFKEALRASFATANKHSKEGIPLASSRRFSSDGTRLHFIRDTIDNNLDKVVELIERNAGNEIEVTFSALLRELSDQGFKLVT